MAEKITAPRAVTLFARIVPFAVGLVGLVFLIAGVGQLVSQSWARATGTVGQCTTQVLGTGTNRQYRHDCQVTWQADGTSHTASVNLGSTTMNPGQSIDLRVDGDSVAVASPVWVGVASAVAGLVLLVVAVLLRRRHRRT
jgi:hypothetical protein